MTDAIATVLLAGSGQADDALATADGEPACRRAVAELPTDELVINCREERRPALAEALGGFAPQFAVDPVEGRGPLAGLLTALRVTAAPNALVIDTESPFLDGRTAERLISTLAETGADAVVIDADGAADPPSAVYRVDAAREAVETTLACGSRRFDDALSRLEVTSIPADAGGQSSSEAEDSADPTDTDGGTRKSSVY